MWDFFVRRESAEDHFGGGSANYADDFDMIISSRSGQLVGVTEVNGVHACWTCFEPFIEDATHPKRAVEYNCGGHGVRILLHASCITTARSYNGNIFLDKVRGHQARRFNTRATKGVAAAAASKTNWPFRSSATKRLQDAARD
jgi:hypothetical protein